MVTLYELCGQVLLETNARNQGRSAEFAAHRPDKFLRRSVFVEVGLQGITTVVGSRLAFGRYGYGNAVHPGLGSRKRKGILFHGGGDRQLGEFGIEELHLSGNGFHTHGSRHTGFQPGHDCRQTRNGQLLAAIDRIYIGCRIGNGFPHDRRGILRGVARRKDRSRQLRGRQGCQGDLGEFRIQVLLLPRDSLYFDGITATGLQSVEAHRRLRHDRPCDAVERTGVGRGVLHGIPGHGDRYLRYGVFRQDGCGQSNGIHGFFVIRATCKSGPEDKKS